MTARQLFNKWVILGSFLLAGFLLVITAVSIGLMSAPQNSGVGFTPADLTVIPAPTSTSSAPATATIDPFAPTATPTGLAIGNYVQITGTEGQGLRIRSEPSLNGTAEFLGYDSEVFIVKDGPRQADGFTWWLLIAPYDETRTGWAASDFLTYIPAPSATP
jgi:hypothetical protein